MYNSLFIWLHYEDAVLLMFKDKWQDHDKYWNKGMGTSYFCP
jgi:hypothetical protein